MLGYTNRNPGKVKTDNLMYNILFWQRNDFAIVSRTNVQYIYMQFSLAETTVTMYTIYIHDWYTISIGMWYTDIKI